MSLDFISWIGISSAVWLLFFVFGRRQLDRVKKGTTDLILDEARQVSRLHPPPGVSAFFTQIQPAWEAMLKQRAWFILHKSELFPVPASPRVVRKRLNFTPAWMGAYLRLNGIELPADAEIEAEIKRILALAPKETPGKRGNPDLGATRDKTGSRGR
jgi:hypothetical protein